MVKYRITLVSYVRIDFYDKINQSYKIENIPFQIMEQQRDIMRSQEIMKFYPILLSLIE